MFPFYQNEYFKCQFCQRPENRTSIFVIYFSFTLWGWGSGREKIAWVDMYWLSLGRDSAFIRVLPLTTFWEVVHLVMAKLAASPSLATLLYTFPIRQRSIRLATLPILLAHSDVVKLLVKKKWMHFEARLLSMKLMVSLHLISSIKKSERRRVLLWHLIPESPYSASLLCRR